MKVLGLFLLTFLLQSCNQPFSIPKRDPVNERPAKKTEQVPGGNYQRFLPVSGNPMFALDTVTGQLCKTYPTLGVVKPDDVKTLALPFCRDLWMASNVPSGEEASGQGQQPQQPSQSDK
jgi:hypothetical protein